MNELCKMSKINKNAYFAFHNTVHIHRRRVFVRRCDVIQREHNMYIYIKDRLDNDEEEDIQLHIGCSFVSPHTH